MRLEWRDANPHLVVTTTVGDEADIPFDEAAYSVQLQPDQDYDTDSLYFAYETPRRPSAWFAYDMSSNTRKTVSTSRSPAFDSGNYVVERLFVPAQNGETVPITVLMSKGARRDDSAPLFLYGYGSYGASVAAVLSAPAISLVDRG